MIFPAKVCPKAINFAIAESIHQLLVLRPHPSCSNQYFPGNDEGMTYITCFTGIMWAQNVWSKKSLFCDSEFCDEDWKESKISRDSIESFLIGGGGIWLCQINCELSNNNKIFKAIQFPLCCLLAALVAVQLQWQRQAFNALQCLPPPFNYPRVQRRIAVIATCNW